MANKKGNNYFELMQDMVDCACRASERLEEILSSFQYSSIDDSLAEMHALEHEGDGLKHELTEKLAKEFITPIEREDIMAMAGEIDDITDCVEDVLIKIYMFNIKTINPNAVEFASIIKQCCNELLCVFKEFSHFKKSKNIHPAIVELNRLEELGDSLYTASVRELYIDDNPNPIHAATWTEVYNCLEKCCDTCEHAADLVENVIMKNS